MSKKEVRVSVYTQLIEDIKNRFHETTRMTATGVVDWGLRKLLEDDFENV